MAEDENSREPLTLRRWSARKLAAAQETMSTQPAEATPPAPPVTAAPSNADAVPEPPPLPPVESLTFDSDFTAFLKADVDESLKRAALKKLLHDPRFNVMDGLDTYIDDYSKPDPIDPDVVKQLMQARYIFNPPQTRVTDAGFVEDVPPEAETQPAPDVAQETPERPATAESASNDNVPQVELPPIVAGDPDTAKLK